MEIKVYIANLGKYNEGVLQGAWFALPVDFDFIAEKIGLNDEYEEYAIHDFESPIDIPEYISIDELNNMYNKLCEIEEWGIVEADIKILISEMGGLDELYNNLDSIVNHGCISLEDYAYEYLEEYLSNIDVDSWLLNYIDYDKFASDIRIERHFIECGNLYEVED